MDLTGEAIQKVVDIASTKTYVVDGRTLSDRLLHNMPLPDEPRYPTIGLCTLGGLVKFVADNKTLVDKGGVITIASAIEVLFVGSEAGVKRQRDVYAHVKIAPQAFRFGQYMNIETFRIELLTRFVDGPNRNAILEYTSNEAIKTLTDNGVSQSVQGKIGIASFGTLEVPSPALLAPIRTFAEIEQPEGTFIFRLQKVAVGPEAALFEIYTDWQRTAVERIYDHLRKSDELKDVPIYA